MLHSPVGHMLANKSGNPKTTLKAPWATYYGFRAEKVTEQFWKGWRERKENNRHSHYENVKFPRGACPAKSLRG